MDVRKWVLAKIEETPIFPIDALRCEAIADAFTPAIMKLVGALRSISEAPDYPQSTFDNLRAQARAAIAEFAKE